MADFVTHLPLSTVTNPVLLWLFKHGWEDPEWGHLPINQVSLGLVLHDLGAKLADKNQREQVQAIAQKIVAENAQRVAR